MKDFNCITCPLSGTHCISSGAGTGKTYAIAHLFLRLLLEKEIPVDSILVVTFTDAATAELRDRIRKLIVSALRYLDGEPADETCTAIVSAHSKKISVKLTRALLYRALTSFDEASICTIHSFCQRVLKDNAFESSMRFDTELVTDRDTLLQETVEDFWRTHIYGASPLFARYLLESGWAPEKFTELISHHIAQPTLRVIPSAPQPETTAAELSFDNAFQAVAEAWPAVSDEIQELLLQSNLHKLRYAENAISSLAADFDTFIIYGRMAPQLFEAFKKVTTKELTAYTKKGGTPPSHPFFSLCDRLQEESARLCSLFEQKLIALKYDLFRHVHATIDKKKQRYNIHTFDDLLTNVYHALRKDTGSALVESVRRQYRAALIDEFQDTDPVQYAIFKPLFADTEDTPLFLIGDPKQAIYSFRGADIFTFIDAVDKTDPKNRHTLRINRRSVATLIQAYNTLFTNTDDPFVYTAIKYVRVKEPPDTPSHGVSCKETPEAPFVLWYCSSSRFSRVKKDGSFATIPVGRATQLLCNAIAREISLLLTHGTLEDDNGQRRIRAGDIAVLVRKGSQARDVKRALSHVHIPAVLHKAGNIFDTPDAREISHILHAIVFPHNHGYIRTALCSSFFGMNGNALFDAVEKNAVIELYYDLFRRYHDLWNRYGFSRMFTAFLNSQQIRKKLLSFPDGERRLTNVLHIMDLLQKQSAENRLSMQELLAWYMQQLNPQSPRLEEHELRLESDEQAVQILTMHKAKGLEYPIVFCPFNWSGSEIQSQEFIYHDDNHTRIYDLGSPESGEHKQRSEREMLAENLRLLYVAVTRAKYKCYLAWGRFNNSETSAPAYLFHKPLKWNDTSSIADLAKHVRSLGDAAMLDSLKQCADRSDGSIEVTELTDIPPAAYTTPVEKTAAPACRQFKGTVPEGRRLSSFSAITARHTADAELPEQEESLYTEEIIAEDTATATEEMNIFTFPRGTTAGLFLHAILEELDFTENNSTLIAETVGRKLTEFCFEHVWRDTITDAVSNLLAHPLVGCNERFSLSAIPEKDTCRELEFYYPLKRITPQSLGSLFRKAGCDALTSEFPEHLESLSFKPTRGYMHGFIDLFLTYNNKYYLIDWKSNYLGNDPQEYMPEKLTAAMVSHNYILQYYIYTLALHKYLRTRIANYSYQKHFGGVFYIFLRGVTEDKNSATGIFFDKPATETVTILEEGLSGS